jgi:rSAM/selenodomain-associated transferase 2
MPSVSTLPDSTLSVSIVIPVLNERAIVSAAVQRALDSGADEVIVADGGSDDGSWQAVQGLDCRAVQCGRGRGTQLNAGARAASGDVLMFLHADNRLASDGVAQIRDCLSDGTILAGAFRQRIQHTGRIYRLIEAANARRASRRGMAYGDQGVFMRREVFEQLGGFDDVPVMEDVLLMRKFRRCGRLALLRGPLYISPRRWQRHGVLRQTLRNRALLIGLRLGVSPQRLASWYPTHRHEE